MRKVVLLTKQYPYGKLEQFLDPEMSFCEDNNIKVDIIQTAVSDPKMECRKMPETVSLKGAFAVSSIRLDVIPAFLKLFFRKEYAEEINYLRQCNVLTWYKMKTAAKFLVRTYRIVSIVESLYKDQLKNNPEEIVFYSYWMEEAACAIAILSKKYGCRAVTRAHGYDLYLERHNERYFPMKWWTVNNIDRVCTVSAMGEQYLKNEYGLNDHIVTERLGTVDYGLSKPNADHRSFTILSCSNVITIKRVTLIAEALKELDMANIKWIHIGDGSQLEKVRKITDQLKNTKALLLGRKNHYEVFELYKKEEIDLFINVSTTEGLPVSIMEAISFGVPVLATNVGGTSEAVDDGKNGRLLSADVTALELANEIKKQIDLSPEDRAEQRYQARKIWCDRFNKDSAYKRFYDYLLTK